MSGQIQELRVYHISSSFMSMIYVIYHSKNIKEHPMNIPLTKLFMYMIYPIYIPYISHIYPIYIPYIYPIYIYIPYISHISLKKPRNWVHFQPPGIFFLPLAVGVSFAVRARPGATLAQWTTRPWGGGPLII